MGPTGCSGCRYGCHRTTEVDAGSLNARGLLNRSGCAGNQNPSNQNGTIFDTLPEMKLLTQVLVPSNATPCGLVPTATVAARQAERSQRIVAEQLDVNGPG